MNLLLLILLQCWRLAETILDSWTKMSFFGVPGSLENFLLEFYCQIAYFRWQIMPKIIKFAVMCMLNSNSTKSRTQQMTRNCSYIARNIEKSHENTKIRVERIKSVGLNSQYSYLNNDLNKFYRAQHTDMKIATLKLIVYSLYYSKKIGKRRFDGTVFVNPSVWLCILLLYWCVWVRSIQST